jgi:hypothetical protein
MEPLRLKIFSKDNNLGLVEDYFLNIKKPFVIRGITKSNVNLNFLDENFSEIQVFTLNPKSEKEKLSISNLIKKVRNGEKYRLRANTSLGNKISNYIDMSFIKSLKNKIFSPLDFLLSFGKTSRQKTLFLSTKGCTFTKHAHIISGLIIHLEGRKTWYISKNREKFSTIKYKNLLHPNPLYVTDKCLDNEFEVELEPGDLLYMPAYWFHYTVSHGINLSFSYFFTEPISYYLKNTFKMFFYEALTNPFQSLIKSIKEEPEEHIFDKKDIVKNCYEKISDSQKRDEALKFFKEGDFS